MAARVPLGARPVGLTSFLVLSVTRDMAQNYRITHGKEHIVLGSGILETLPQLLLEKTPKVSRYVLITDQHVYQYYGAALLKNLANSGIIPLVKVIPPGETAKCRKVKAEIEDWMLSHYCNRDTAIIALGGGVVGDLAGFVAATFLRGIPFVQVPTTLLAMVDSSIGGKTGIDSPLGKNLIGAFHHPLAVLIDPLFLKTLPKREFVNGMAEVIKTAAIRDPKLWNLLEENVDSILGQDAVLLEQVIFTCASIKAEVVDLDERESGIRSILNWGHTVGHAIEALLEYELLHGECVSIGMVVETQLSNLMGHLQSPSICGRVARLCEAFGLPVTCPKSVDPEDIIKKMSLDKKNAAMKVRMTVLKNIGDVFPNPLVVETATLRRQLLPQISVIPPKAPINGVITVPGSKSISNRVLLLCALAEGTCELSGLLHAHDTHVMLDSLSKLGVKFEWESSGEVLRIHGTNGKFKIPTKPLYLGNAGTATRFLTTMCSLVEGSVTLTGCDRLSERPISDLIEALASNGCSFEFIEKEGHIPFTVKGTGFPGGDLSLSASVSSQFVSSILITAPYAKTQVRLQTKGNTVSKTFIDMTISIQKQFGIQVQQVGDQYTVGQGSYKNPPRYTVESDASSASYPLALAAATGGTVTVRNVGNESIQGDALFYTVLQKMGCTVTQTKDHTTVQGPQHGLLKAVNVDMADLTDTFMTIAAIAVLAEGTTSITNIANQRVKECNRIAVMVEELGKCGVVARELPDGIQIEGCGSNLQHLKGASIQCHKDHRIAMSFAVLGTRVPGIVITDKECVDKTYPEFWDDLERVFGIQLTIPTQPSHTQQEGSVQASMEAVNGPSIVLIGMRGSGKTLSGTAVAHSLHWDFLDADQYFEEKTGHSIKQYIEQGNTLQDFRKLELQLLKEAILAHPNNTIIATGGGIVETPEGREFLSTCTTVKKVHLSRDFATVKAYLDGEKDRINLGETVEALWDRRAPYYELLADYCFHISKDERWESVNDQLHSFVRHIVKPSLHQPIGSADSFFVCLTAPTITEVVPHIADISQHVHAIEIRVDLLKSHCTSFLMEGLYALKVATSLPLIWTVRSKAEGGNFSGSVAEYTRILGLKALCEYVDVEATHIQDPSVQSLLASYPYSAVIASHHDYSNRPTAAHLQDMIKRCDSPLASIMKVVGFAEDVSDVFVLQQVRQSLELKKPLISVLAGPKGSLSRVLNRTLTPVCHPLLKAGAPGQLTVDQILKFREELNL